ncbi:MAG: NAD(P)-dependent oxidoreductase [Actinomycetota bacterium]|nr:NAD(P)-dependent oxidoreductase [Actinomycetota bacterium]
MGRPLAGRLRDGEERIAVTGATGWLGRVTLDLLREAMGSAAFGRRVSAYASRARAVDGIEVQALAALGAADPPPDVIVHYAFVTREQAGKQELGAYVAANLEISLEVLRALGRGGVRGFFYTSSGAVYDAAGRLETDLHANPYGALKHLDELAFAQACQVAGTGCAIARVFNVSGPHMAKPRLFALGDLVLCALAGEPLLVRARHPVRRSFVAAADVAALGLSLALAGEDALFDTAGERVVELGELATLVAAEIAAGTLPVHRDPDPQAPAHEYVGRAGEMAGLARRHGVQLASLEQQIRDTASGLNSVQP